jgi:hypothetical protein
MVVNQFIARLVWYHPGGRAAFPVSTCLRRVLILGGFLPEEGGARIPRFLNIVALGSGKVCASETF